MCTIKVFTVKPGNSEQVDSEQPGNSEPFSNDQSANLLHKYTMY